MTIIRGASAGDAVVTILRAAAQDSRLSFRARGVLVALMSRPKDWRTDYRRIAGEGREGERAVLTALAELEQYGYLRRERMHNGRHIVTAWEISDRPGRRFLQPTYLQPTKVQPTKQQPTKLQGLQERETERETPPPTPAVDELADAKARGLAGVVVDEIDGKAPKPATGVLRTACRRLAEDGWTKEQLAAAVRAHDWHGARAGAVVAYLRGLTPEDKPSAQAAERARKRPDWCGACDETTRLTEDPKSGRQRRCPTCHPLATKTRRTM